MNDIYCLYAIVWTFVWWLLIILDKTSRSMYNKMEISDGEAFFDFVIWIVVFILLLSKGLK